MFFIKQILHFWLVTLSLANFLFRNKFIWKGRPEKDWLGPDTGLKNRKKSGQTNDNCSFFYLYNLLWYCINDVTNCRLFWWVVEDYLRWGQFSGTSYPGRPRPKTSPPAHTLYHAWRFYLFICVDDVGSWAPIVEKEDAKTLKITTLWRWNLYLGIGENL